MALLSRVRLSRPFASVSLELLRYVWAGCRTRRSRARARLLAKRQTDSGRIHWKEARARQSEGRPFGGGAAGGPREEKLTDGLTDSSLGQAATR
ncbi:hypothetical protein LX32DRAFT_633293 [Colletotrichum zoysiae]|uniref:Uncharacterized protein n=1 Tax=Colletotrichum zoysiae TaxID=1216348 RepID=A0AAD9HUG7_9PEZI|nr:hypothetical protein LX32DRAFT_633293 [Colletotrichum zoysiae]